MRGIPASLVSRIPSLLGLEVLREADRTFVRNAPLFFAELSKGIDSCCTTGGAEHLARAVVVVSRCARPGLGLFETRCLARPGASCVGRRSPSHARARPRTGQHPRHLARSSQRCHGSCILAIRPVLSDLVLTDDLLGLRLYRTNILYKLPLRFRTCAGLNFGLGNNKSSTTPRPAGASLPQRNTQTLRTTGTASHPRSLLNCSTDDDPERLLLANQQIKAGPRRRQGRPPTSATTSSSCQNR